MQERLLHQNLRLPQTQPALSTKLPLLEPYKPAHWPRTKISTCAIENVKQHKVLAAAELDAMELPFGCELAALHNLLDGYSCTEWEEIYRYSFCLERVVQDSCAWHCTQCGM
tara:strand:- start:402 stop:737 length:336 start_codon:yes stop_codon:yes gene_type:complete